MDLILLQSGNNRDLNSLIEFSHNFNESTVINNMEFLIGEKSATTLFDEFDEKNDAPIFSVYKMKVIVDGKFLFSIINPNLDICKISLIVNNNLRVIVETKGVTDEYVYLNLRATKIL